MTCALFIHESNYVSNYNLYVSIDVQFFACQMSKSCKILSKLHINVHNAYHQGGCKCWFPCRTLWLVFYNKTKTKIKVRDLKMFEVRLVWINNKLRGAYFYCTLMVGAGKRNPVCDLQVHLSHLLLWPAVFSPYHNNFGQLTSFEPTSFWAQVSCVPT